MRKYVELTLAYDDTNPDVIEESHRTKEDEGAWSESTEVAECSARSVLHLQWVQLEMKLEV